MAFEAQTARALSGADHFAAGVKALVTSAAVFGARAAAISARFVNRMQLARMQSTLTQMSDSQLSQIGIARSDIPSYAASLVAAERNRD